MFANQHSMLPVPVGMHVCVYQSTHTVQHSLEVEVDPATKAMMHPACTVSGGRFPSPYVP